jgi:hypothetical protein
MAVLAGCGTQSSGVQPKPLTPSEARNIIKSIKPGCNTPGHVLIRYSSPEMHGKGSDSWWCVEPPRAYRTISRDVHCAVGMRLRIDLQRHRATCESSN